MTSITVLFLSNFLSQCYILHNLSSKLFTFFFTPSSYMYHRPQVSIGCRVKIFQLSLKSMLLKNPVTCTVHKGSKVAMTISQMQILFSNAMQFVGSKSLCCSEQLCYKSCNYFNAALNQIITLAVRLCCRYELMTKTLWTYFVWMPRQVAVKTAKNSRKPLRSSCLGQVKHTYIMHIKSTFQSLIQFHWQG